MPCNCTPKVYSYPENSEWGPLLWIILHSLAERATKVVSPLFEIEERKTWISLLQTTESILPCPDCRAHYKQWIDTHPVSIVQTMAYADLREFLRRWLYDLHQNVNSFSGKPGIAYEDLSTRYRSENIPATFKNLEPVEKRAIQLQGIKLQPWANWVKLYKSLLNVYGV